jgi:hypothetical protein
MAQHKQKLRPKFAARYTLRLNLIRSAQLRDLSLPAAHRDAFLQAVASALTEAREHSQPSIDKRQHAVIDRNDAAVSVGIGIAERDRQDTVVIGEAEHH